MKFHEKLNEYMKELGCTSKDISTAAEISAATFSRYRSGDRIPEMGSASFDRLCTAISQIAATQKISQITKASVYQSFLTCEDFVAVDKEILRQNFNALISALNLNLTKLCRQTNYDISTIFRFRNGTRQPSDPIQFASAIASYVVRELDLPAERMALAQLINCEDEAISDPSVRYSRLQQWLLEEQPAQSDNNNLSGFLNKLDQFDLNEYIKAIHFDEMKVPTVPFQLPTSKTYYGLSEMMESELDFLKATVLSKSQKPVTFYSDMPMGEMAKDPDFPKKWMYGMALMLKKGLHLNNIHNLNRSFDEMMLGLESWIPMYMTGQISPYYLKSSQSSVFHHFLRVSGAAALTGEAIVEHHSNGRYYLSKTKEDIAYYQRRADDLLKSATPLMDIYREDKMSNLQAFILSDLNTPGKRRNILSAPPIYTMDSSFLKLFLQNHSVSEEDSKNILEYAAVQRDFNEKILSSEKIEDEILQVSEEEFVLHPVALSLSGIFSKKDIHYTYEEYAEHLQQTQNYAAVHSNYHAAFTSANPFRNLQIIIHEGKWVMISKGNTPAIHFVIHHPKLRNAIENFVPPVVEK